MPLGGPTLADKIETWKWLGKQCRSLVSMKPNGDWWEYAWTLDADSSKFEDDRAFIKNRFPEHRIRVRRVVRGMPSRK